MLILLLAVLVTPMFIGGWSFSKKAMAPKMSRVNPLKGIKRVFGLKGLMELVKSLAKVALVGCVAGLFIWNYFSELLSLGRLPVGQAIMRALELGGWLFLLLSIATLVIAAIDVPFQLFQHNKQLKMSKQEVKDENKHTEGDPEVKGRIRRLQQEMANSRMMEEVPKADVIVTNPTHYSIALKYDDNKMGAPILVAKGTDLIAFRIRELGKQNNITIFEAPPLARALYHTTELNQEIPADLYYAVAQVLAYVFQLKRAKHPGERPEKPNNLDIPEEYQKYSR
jgi:flagellar biosynthetic protein FlhB